MPASLYGLTSIKIDRFGGLNTLLDPTNLPPWSSPYTQNCEYYPGLVKTRPGLTSEYNITIGTITGMATYILPDQTTKRFLAFDVGTLYKDVSGTLTPISSAMEITDYANFAPAFGREYIAFGDEKNGKDIPRAYDDVNFDRVSQVGPGAPPTGVTQEFIEIDTITRSNMVMDIALLSAFTVAVGDAVTITGALDPTFNGSYIVCSVADTLHFSVFACAWGFDSLILSRSGGVVSVTLPQFLSQFELTIGSDMVVTSALDASFNGRFSLASADLTTGVMTWLQAGTDAATPDGAPTFLKLAPEGGGNFEEFQYAVTSIQVLSGTATVTLDGVVNGGDMRIYGSNTEPGSISYVILLGPLGAAQTVVSAIGKTSYTFSTGEPDQITYLSTNAFLRTSDSATTGGQIAQTGHVDGGVHKVAVAFITRNGYITKPSPFRSFNAMQGATLSVAGIPVGPENIIARLLLFTASGRDNYFYIPFPATGSPTGTQLNDNTSTEMVVDFSDTALLSGTPADNLFGLVELGECAGVSQYASRLAWTGERAKLEPGLLNLTFDGGWSLGTGPGGADVPLGWTAIGEGGHRVASAVFGDAYAITGNGVDFRGQISQNALADSLGNPIFQINTSYSVRVKLYSNANHPSTFYNLAIDLYSPSLNVEIGVINFSVEASTGPTEASGVLLTPQTSLPDDLVFRVIGGILPNGRTVIVDSIEPYKTDQPFNGSLVRISGVDDPDSYQGVTGFIQPNPNNGQAIRATFSIRDFLYIAKESSLYVTKDDGVSEPNGWQIAEVSNTVGTPATRGVGLGEEWAIIAARAGVYLFDGGAPEKISQEIQPTWEQINWSFGHLMEVRVDTKRKRVYIAAPFGDSETNNVIFTVDYIEGWGDPLGNRGTGRKWNVWTIRSGAIALIDKNDGTETFIGGLGGKIYRLDDAAKSDDGDAIESYWQPGFFQSGGRILFGYLSANIVGNGVCTMMMRRGAQDDIRTVRGWYLNVTGFNNQERRINYVGQRMSIVFGTNDVDHYFSLQGLEVYAQPSAWGQIRGINA